MDVTETARDLLDLPYHRANDIEVVAVTETTAHTRWPYDRTMVGNPEVPAIHGGVISALADLTGAAPFVGSLGRYTPTVDLRVDYLDHAGEADLEGHAEVIRRGDSVGVAETVVVSGGDECATGRGVYKLDR